MTMAKKDFINKMAYHEYYTRLKNIALTIFKWEGLPETCNARFLEDTLYHYGKAVFVEDSEMSYLNLMVTPAAELNVYKEPLAYTAHSIGYNKIYSKDDCVIIRNNPVEKSTESTIMYFAEKLAEIDLAIMVNVKAQKTPVLIRCDEKILQSMKALYAQYDGNSPVIYGSKTTLTDRPLEVLETGAPYVADKLRAEKQAVFDEILEFLGINTNPADKKKERLIQAEVDSNNEQIDIQCLTMLGTRQKACDEIKAKYGVEVKVSLRVEELKSLWDYNLRLHGDVPQSEIMGIIGKQEVVENGKLHG